MTPATMSENRQYYKPQRQIVSLNNEVFIYIEIGGFHLNAHKDEVEAKW